MKYLCCLFLFCAVSVAGFSMYVDTEQIQQNMTSNTEVVLANILK